MVTQACMTESGSTLRWLWVLQYWEANAAYSPSALHISRLGAASENCCSKHGGQQGWEWKPCCSREQPPQHHRLAKEDRQSENHKNFKTFSDDLAWPNHSTSERASYKVALAFAPGYTKSKCWAKTSGDSSHVTFQLGSFTHPGLPWKRRNRNGSSQASCLVSWL